MYLFEKPGPRLTAIPLAWNVGITIRYPRQIAEDDVEEYHSSESDRKEQTFLVVDEHYKMSIMTKSEIEKRGYIRVE